MPTVLCWCQGDCLAGDVGVLAGDARGVLTHVSKCLSFINLIYENLLHRTIFTSKYVVISIKKKRLIDTLCHMRSCLVRFRT